MAENVCDSRAHMLEMPTEYKELSEEEKECDGGLGWGMFAAGCIVSAVGFIAGVAAKKTKSSTLSTVSRVCTVAGAVMSACTVVGIAKTVATRATITTCQAASGAYASTIGVSDVIVGAALW